MSCGLMRFFASHLFFLLCLTHFLCSLSSQENASFFLFLVASVYSPSAFPDTKSTVILTNESLKRFYPSKPVGCRTPHRNDGSHFCSLLSGIRFLSISFSVNETFEEECEEVAEHLFIKGQTRSCRRDGMRALSESFLRTFEE